MQAPPQYRVSVVILKDSEPDFHSMEPDSKIKSKKYDRIIKTLCSIQANFLKGLFLNFINLSGFQDLNS